jgi:hypothetical protein
VQPSIRSFRKARINSSGSFVLIIEDREFRE